MTSEFSNYKEVDGITVPFRIRQLVNGQVMAEVIYDAGAVRRADGGHAVHDAEILEELRKLRAAERSGKPRPVSPETPRGSCS